MNELHADVHWLIQLRSHEMHRKPNKQQAAQGTSSVLTFEWALVAVYFCSHWWQQGVLFA